MCRILAVSVVLATVLIGCSTPKTELERQREAFRLSHVPHEEKSTFLRANDLISDGDHFYSEARRTDELKQKTNLLRRAAAKYRRAVLMLRGILPRVQDPTDRKYISDTISHTEASIEETVRALPIFEE